MLVPCLPLSIRDDDDGASHMTTMWPEILLWRTTANTAGSCSSIEDNPLALVGPAQRTSSIRTAGLAGDITGLYGLGLLIPMLRDRRHPRSGRWRFGRCHRTAGLHVLCVSTNAD